MLAGAAAPSSSPALSQADLILRRFFHKLSAGQKDQSSRPALSPFQSSPGGVLKYISSGLLRRPVPD